MKSKLIVTERLCKNTSPGRRILSDVSLTISSSEVVAIIGPNGCGKSTLLRLLAGAEVVAPDMGTIQRNATRVAYVPQTPILSLLPWFSAARNMVHISSGRLTHAEANDKLKGFGFSSQDCRLHPQRLSGGMQQRLSIACALALNPECLLLDEPFSGQDSRAVQWLVTSIRKLASSGMAVVLVTHDPIAALLCADRIIVLRPDLEEGTIIHRNEPVTLDDRSVRGLNDAMFIEKLRDLYESFIDLHDYEK